jgi:hypothetical protein
MGMLMTEAEWLACTDPAPMLEFLRSKASERTLSLFSVACARRIQHLVTDDRGRRSIDVGEQFLNGLARRTTPSGWQRPRLTSV